MEIEKREGIEIEETDTSPVEEQEQEETEISLSNNPVPTEEEEIDAGIVDDEHGIAETTTEKMFTQSQVDEIAGKSRKEGRDRALRDVYSRYGVNSEEELDDLFGDSQRFITTRDEFDAAKKAWEAETAQRQAEFDSLKEQMALYDSGINKDRYEDAKLILKGKGLAVTAENIMQELATHPEWRNVAEQEETSLSVGNKIIKKKEPATRINVLGNPREERQEDPMSEYEKAMKLFKV